MNNKQKGLLLSLISSASLALTSVIGEFLLNHVNPLTMVWLWFLCSSALFLIYFTFSNKLDQIMIIIKNIKKTGFIGFISSLSAPLWSYGIVYTGANVAAFISQFYVIITIVLGVVFLRERLLRMEGLGILIAIFGGLAMTYSSTDIKFYGSMIILFSAFLFSIQYFLAKVFSKKLDSSLLAAARSMFTFICLSIYISFIGVFFPSTDWGLTYNGFLEISVEAWMLAFAGALCGPFGGMVMLYKSLSFLEISKTMTVRTISQFLTMFYSFILLSVIPTNAQLIGGAFIVLGIIVLILSRERIQE